MSINKTLKELEEVAIHCPTKQKALELLRTLAAMGVKWCDNESLLPKSEWDKYREETAYKIDCYERVSYSPIGYYKRGKYKCMHVDDLLIKVVTPDELYKEWTKEE